jgi:hypothetical protein
MYRHMADAPSARGLVTSEALADDGVVEVCEKQSIQLGDILVEDGLDAARPIRCDLNFL